MSLHWYATSPPLLYERLHLFRRLSGETDSLGTRVASVGQAGCIADTDSCLASGVRYEHRVGVQDWEGRIAWWSPWLETALSPNAPTIRLANFSPTWSGYTTLTIQESVLGVARDYQMLVDGEHYSGFYVATPDIGTTWAQWDRHPVFRGPIEELTPGRHVIQVIAAEGNYAVATPPVSVNVLNPVGGIRGPLKDLSLGGDYVRFRATPISEDTW